MRELEIHRLGDPASKTAILCLHGGPGMDHSYFLPHLSPLAERHALILYRQHQNGETTMDGLIVELERVLKTIKNERLLILGHSFGAVLALEYMRRNPKANLAGLVLVSWVYDRDLFKLAQAKNPELFTKMEAAEAAIEREFAKASVDERYQRRTNAWAEAYFAPECVGKGRQVLSAIHYNDSAYQSLGSSYMGSFDLKSSVKALRLPCISIAGTSDRVVDAEYIRAGARLNSKIRHVEIQGAGHFPFVEKQREILAAISSFIEEVSQ